jgi:non-ribosomal peptide synthetase component E (peptide arylation enzyme)
VAVEAEERMGCPIIQGYGAVDFGTGSTTVLGDPREVRLLTAGEPMPGCEIRLLDDEGLEVPRGEVGEIMLSGPVGASGYYRDLETTWQVWTRDGWYRTGDKGKINEQGKLMILGRKKDMIIRGGQNIYPAEIENLLLGHPKVLGVAVVGMPDPVMGERACAYVATRESQEFTFDEMISFLKEKNMAPYKLPERLELIESIPMVGADQKVDKNVLRQDIIEKLKGEGAKP